MVGDFLAKIDLDNEDPDSGERQWKPKFFHDFPQGARAPQYIPGRTQSLAEKAVVSGRVLE